VVKTVSVQVFGILTEPFSSNEEISYATTITLNRLVDKYRQRMPVILQKDKEETWLNPDIVEPDHLLSLLRPYPPDEMEQWQVTGAARNPKNKNDYPDLITPVKST
jgi:putative SOS response-associated peptidase YedK